MSDTQRTDMLPAEQDLCIGSLTRIPRDAPGSWDYLKDKKQLARAIVNPPALAGMDAMQHTINWMETFNPALEWWGMLSGAKQAMSGVKAATREHIETMLMNYKGAHSDAMAQRMEDKGRGFSKADPLAEVPGGIFTHNEDGSLNRIPSKDLLPHFAKGKEQDWPQIILTANHALSAVSENVSEIMNGFNALTYHVEGKPLNLIRKFDAESKVTSDQTIMLSSVAAENNAWLNAAQLIRRFNYLEKMRETDGSLEQKLFPPEDEHPYCAPNAGAIRLSKLMLKMMVENPEAVDIDETCPISQIIDAGGEVPILRDDAENIARHVTCIGYSKGVNTMTDALRFLAYELSAERNRMQGSYIQQRNLLGDVQRISQEDVATIIRQIGNIGIAGAEVPFSSEEHKLGIRSLRINGTRDIITQHFLKDDDPIHLFETGSNGVLGHDPKKALGTMQSPGDIHQNPHITNKISVVLAAKYGRLALAGIHYVDGENMGAGSALQLHFGPGASGEQIQAFGKALTAHYQDGTARFERMHNNHWQLSMEGKTSGDVRRFSRTEDVPKLAEILQELNRSEDGLVVADNVFEHLNLIRDNKTYDAAHPMVAFMEGRAPRGTGHSIG